MKWCGNCPLRFEQTRLFLVVSRGRYLFGVFGPLPSHAMRLNGRRRAGARSLPNRCSSTSGLKDRAASAATSRFGHNRRTTFRFRLKIPPNRASLIRSNTRMGNDDHALIRAVLAGDKDAYGLLVERHSESVFRVAFRITESEADSDEVVQETFLRGYRSLADFHARSSFRTWIYRIAMNSALKTLDKRKAEASIPVVEEYDDGRPGIQLTDPAAGPDRLLLDREIEARRHAAMEKMSPTERLAFVLRHLEGRSTEEIAAALDMSQSSAKQAVFRAVQKLRRSLAPLWVKS